MAVSISWNIEAELGIANSGPCCNLHPIYLTPEAGRPLLAMAGVAPCTAPEPMLATDPVEISGLLQHEGGANMKRFHVRRLETFIAVNTACLSDLCW